VGIADHVPVEGLLGVGEMGQRVAVELLSVLQWSRWNSSALPSIRMDRTCGRWGR
jgi:hypothetical protein